jgi:predicted dehydrogenase
MITSSCAAGQVLPQSRTPDCGHAPPLRWAVAGTGWAAHRFVTALRACPTQTVTAVVSRSPQRAAAFAARFGLAEHFGTYEAVLEQPGVDVVYVATEHTSHLSYAEAALTAGKHVLVEKPLAVNAGEAARIATVAARERRFCMEAFWTLCLPKFDVIRQILNSDMLGDIQTVLIDIGENLTSTGRVLRRDLAGGAMLDLGTYAFGLAHWILGPLAVAAASGQHHPAGVMGQVSALLTDSARRQGLVHCTVLSHTPSTAVVAGSAGTLVIDGPFFHPGRFEIRFNDGTRLSYDEPNIAHGGMFWQAAEVARCVNSGALQSPLRPLEASVTTLALMDRTRQILGDRFPGE